MIFGYKLNTYFLFNLVFWFIVFLFLIKGIDLIYFTYPDESRNAFATYYMFYKNTLYNWVVPYYNGEIRYDKPALIYYIANLFYLLLKNFNVSIEVSYRLVSVFSMFFSAIIGFKFGNILFENIFYRYLSVVIFISFVNIFVESKAFVPEPLFTFFILLSFYLFFRFYQTQNYLYLNLFLISLALANFTKGIVSYIIILLPIFMFLFFYNRYSLKQIFFIFLNKKLILGWLGHFIVGYTWYLLVYLFTNGEFIKNFLLLHNIGRFTGTSKMHLNPFYFYFIVIIINVIPIWELVSLILANLNKIKFKDYLKNSLHIYLIFVFTFILIFYSLSKGKVHHYIMPTFLPLSLFLTNFIKNILESNFLINKSKFNLFMFLFISTLFSIFLLFFYLNFNLNTIQFINVNKIIFNLVYLNLFFTFLIVFIFLFDSLKYFRIFVIFVFSFIKIILFYSYILNDINLKKLSSEFIEIIVNSDNKEIITIGDIASISFYNLYFNKSEKTINLPIDNSKDYVNILNWINKKQIIVFCKSKYLDNLKNAILNDYKNDYNYKNEYKIVSIKKVFVVSQKILLIQIEKK
ncbi:MAG: ArnT family glycosyltransferase [bacterium]